MFGNKSSSGTMIKSIGYSQISNLILKKNLPNFIILYTENEEEQNLA